MLFKRKRYIVRKYVHRNTPFSSIHYGVFDRETGDKVYFSTIPVQARLKAANYNRQVAG